MSDKVLYIVRGLPGSGKSTVARHRLRLGGEFPVREADKFPGLSPDRDWETFVSN